MRPPNLLNPLLALFKPMRICYSAGVKKNVTVSVDEDLRNEIAELAAIEERSFSAMWSLLVREGLSFRGDGVNGQVGGRVFEAEVVSPPLVLAGPRFEFGSSGGRPKSKRARTELCEHRLPPAAFCRWCD